MKARIIKGACHCQNIRYELTWPADAFPITKRECGCTFCRKHGASYTSHPESSLKVKFKDESKVQYYRFGHETADFVLCRDCGGMMFALSEIEGVRYAVINVNHFENVDADELIRSSTDFDGESVESRLARRKRNWTPAVSFAQDSASTN